MADKIFKDHDDSSSVSSLKTNYSISSSRYSAKQVYSVIANNANKKGVSWKKFPKSIRKMVKVISPLLWLQIRNGVSYHHALLDSGSALNLISKELLKVMSCRPLGQYAVHVKGVNNTSELRDQWYMVDLEFQNGETIPVPFLVGIPPKSGYDFGDAIS